MSRSWVGPYAAKRIFVSHGAALIAVLVTTGLSLPADAAPIVVEGTSLADVINVSGSAVEHEIYGRAGNDRIIGSRAGDRLDGGYGYDDLDGGPGDDQLYGASGNDDLVGAGGTDTARFLRARSKYVVTGTPTAFRVDDTGYVDGTDTLMGIEFVDFADRRYSAAELLAPPSDALLERIAAAPEGTWLKVNVNRFNEVWTPSLQRVRVNGIPIGDPAKIIRAWSSMAWDRNRRQLIIWVAVTPIMPAMMSTASTLRHCAGNARRCRATWSPHSATRVSSRSTDR